MDFYKNLPKPAQIGIPVVVGLLVLAIGLKLALAKPAPIELFKTRNIGVYETSQQVLKAADIPYTTESDVAQQAYIIKVLKEDKTEASDALAGSGIEDQAGKIPEIECPAPPGFTATKKANERADNCEDAKAVQLMLKTAGASAANVKVSQKANSTLLGPETSKSVLGQVFLKPTMRDGNWRADEAARAIAAGIGTSIDNVIITDDKLQTLFDGSRASSVSGGGGGAGALIEGVGSGTGCADMASATEIATKEAAVRSCYKDTISADLVKLLGGSDRFVLTVNARIDAKTRTATSQRNRRGAIGSRLRDTGEGRKLDDVNMEPDVSNSSEMKPAGDIAKLQLSVTLDANHVDERQELAVKRLLSTYVDPVRKDPAPNVTRISFASGAGGNKINGAAVLDDIRSEATPGTGIIPTRRAKEPAASTLPMGLLILLGVVVAGLVGAIVLLVRRSSQAAAERERYEQEFQNQQRVLDSYAQQNPDDIARDLEALFGAPAAQEPTYR